MLINFVVPTIGTSGGIEVIYKYVDMLILRGYDVCVYKELKASNMHRYKYKIKNIIHQVYCTAKNLIQKRKYEHLVDKFVWEISDNTVRDADVIVATAWPTAYKVIKLSDIKGEKYYFIQGYEVWDNEELVKKSYLFPTKKIVVSTWINNCLKRDLGIGPFPVVYNGIDLELFHSVKIQKEKRTKNFLMLNHDLPEKGVSNGLKVFENIMNNYENCRLRMFGMNDGGKLPEYVEYYRDPTKEKLVELYSMSDIFIFPSISEGWGLTPLEAMACGCIVVGTRTGFVEDIGRHKVNMMISDPGDVEGMINNIYEILEDEKLETNIRNNSKECIKMLNWELSCDRLEEILLESRKYRQDGK